ncbi:MAG: pre-peptidase [Planctomycetaceae bacterium]|nr:pre-peptidase [Planctomycetaceae bacterium]
MNRYLILLLTVSCGLLIRTESTDAQTSYPMIMSLSPNSAQIGQTSELTIQSRYDLSGTRRIWISGEGVTAEPIHPEVKEGEKPKSTTSLKIKVTVAPDAQTGVREFRLSTVNGASTIGQMVVVRDPVVVETKDNNTRETASVATLPATMCGAIERNEDLDFFKFTAEAGQTACFHVRSQRLQDKIHDLQQHIDPILFLRNSSGSTIASSDNHFFGDPFICHTFKQAGDYYLEIRDVRYTGNKYWEYCIESNSRPFVSNVHPLGVPAGQETTLELIGFNLPDQTQVTWTAPADAKGAMQVELPLAEGVTNPAPVYVTSLPTVLEAAPEQQVSLPAAVSGRIAAEKEIDRYRFTAKKGDKWTFEVKARRHGSALDPIIRILDADGKPRGENDDFSLYKRTYADSRLENWTAPADGEYVIEIRDLHLRGGEDYVYLIEATQPEPYFELYLDTDKTQITPGGWGVLFANVVRKNGFTGGVQLHVDGLPEGVTASAGRVLPGKPTAGCIVFHAPKDIQVDMWNIDVWGTAEVPMGDDQQPIELVSTATTYQEIYQPGGGRGHWPVLTHTIATTEPGDILSLSIDTNEVVLKPGESKKIEVTIERAEGFDKNVTLDILFQHLARPFADTLPPGVAMDKKNSKIVLAGKDLTGHITLKADDNATPAENQQAAIMANIALNFVMKWTYSSEPISVTVLPKE